MCFFMHRPQSQLMKAVSSEMKLLYLHVPIFLHTPATASIAMPLKIHLFPLNPVNSAHTRWAEHCSSWYHKHICYCQQDYLLLSLFLDMACLAARGVKRARTESTEPSVRVIYSDLTRESKRKLMELMQRWSEWQTRTQRNLKDDVEEVLESGEETYYPALQIGSEKSCPVSFWVDIQARESAAVEEDSVPLYDREFTLGSTPLGDSSNIESPDFVMSQPFVVAIPLKLDGPNYQAICSGQWCSSPYTHAAIHILEQGDMSIDEYYSAYCLMGPLMSMVPRCTAAECTTQTFIEKFFTYRFVMGVRPEFESIRSRLLHGSALTMAQTLSDLITEETRLRRADKDDSRCFNCGSYSHALKDCPKPRDNVAISNARKQHNLKRNQSNANRVQNRYYQKTPGKFDDLRAGVLGPETRELLGIGWSILDVVEDEDKPSGITIFGDDEVKLDFEEGELPEQGEPAPPRKRMTVEFPGINAPIPENGDRWLWGSTPPQSSGRHHSSESREYRDRGPPGVDHYSSRYHSYDYGPQSPSLGRSHSDRRSPSRYENSPADDGAWAPHSYPGRQYSSHYSTSSDMSSRHSRDRHDRHYHHRR
ncbi:hypothetical protein PR202_ga17575 [Eleusine coracana subsp. coracana]|uniref:CCHC-type domain-containing protein n=1 Tax=Eleusine coracana subsp. coracana TaxID=191504 RepID=A0AAV5CNM9_ELECO|nr:hypothetical protein PR202_ga17328 [Eleusine coracana subsp. coracana]GJN00396.1 hypothetical protein PR202_ga17575 [Eleusine coracana subsp. coracana]